MPTSLHAPTRTTDAAEQAHFAAHSNDWWEPNGTYRALHAYTPARLAFIRQAVLAGLGRELTGLAVLDIGCGGGLLCEPLARLGAQVTGIDSAAEGIHAARAHASDLPIRYLVGEAGDLTERFDVVIASEVLEHVSDTAAFLAQARARLKPQGILVISTLNRTLPALVLGVVVAEHVLGLAPKGTHHWQKFRKPSEVVAALAQLGLETKGMSGARYNPLTNRMRLAPQALAINYLLWAQESSGRAAKTAAQRAPRARGSGPARRR